MISSIDTKPDIEDIPFGRRFPKSKREFVLPFFRANGLAAGLAALQVGWSILGKEKDGLSWLIALITHSAIVAQATESWPPSSSGLPSLIATGGLGLAALSVVRPLNKTAFASVAVLGVAGSVIYSYWFSAYGRRPNGALVVGSRMPDIELLDLVGQAVRSADFKGKPTALFFVRGNWCPFCTRQVHTIVSGYGSLAEQGIQVAIISPQPEDESRLLAEKFGVDILWLRDPHLRVAKQLEIFDESGVPTGTPDKYGIDTLLPTLVVLDADLTILGLDETDNFRVRPEPSTVLAILKNRNAAL